MLNLCDEDFDAMELVEGALALNKAINPETQLEWAHIELARLLKEAELALVHERDEKARFEAFCACFIKSGALAAIAKPTLILAMPLLIKYCSGAKAFPLV